MSVKVKHLEQGQIDSATAMLGRAFALDPMFGYITSEKSRESKVEWFCGYVLRYCLGYQHTYTTAGDVKGVASWIPPGHTTDNILQALRAGLLVLPFKLHWQKLKQFMTLGFAMEERHKQAISVPHWYLMMLGVDPSHQGKGVGGLLMQPILKQADRDGMLCYLETSTDSAVRFYQKHGFEVVWKGQIAEDSPHIWTMKREPKKMGSGEWGVGSGESINMRDLTAGCNVNRRKC